MSDEANPYVRVQPGVIGRIINYGAWISLVEYEQGGILYRVYIENDDFEVIQSDE